MLKICIYPEPTDFNTNVRVPGTDWLRSNPNAAPTNYPNYWTRCLPELNRIYKGICCYYGMFIESVLGGGTVDHYFPKSKYPHLAYEWTNFRYSSTTANSRKWNHLDVIDPADLPSINTFLLDFGTGEIYYDDLYPQDIKDSLSSTIVRLKLNNQDLCDARLEHYTAYLRNEITESGLRARSPFVYMEAVRQQLL